MKAQTQLLCMWILWLILTFQLTNVRNGFTVKLRLIFEKYSRMSYIGPVTHTTPFTIPTMTKVESNNIFHYYSSHLWLSLTLSVVIFIALVLYPALMQSSATGEPFCLLHGFLTNVQYIWCRLHDLTQDPLQFDGKDKILRYLRVWNKIWNILPRY